MTFKTGSIKKRLKKIIATKFQKLTKVYFIFWPKVCPFHLPFSFNIQTYTQQTCTYTHMDIQTNAKIYIH